MKKIQMLLAVLFSLFCSGTLFSQLTFTFTNAGATGRFGPIQSQINAAYLSTNLNGSVTIVTQGIQEFTVPITGGYKIEASGGQGYGPYGGRGAFMSGEFQLTAGQVLRILVGHQGVLPANTSYNAQYGGAGGTFVSDLSNNPLIVAGGGGGSWAIAYSANSDAPVTNNGNPGLNGTNMGAAGTGGNGGGSGNSGDGGGGFTGNGTGNAAGLSFINGGVGGLTTYGEGGFGGGGGTSSFNNRRGGGGGGYSGGGGVDGGTTTYPEGGGGGSFNNGTNQNNLAGANYGNGMVVITRLCNVNITPASNPICIGSNVTLSTNAVTTLSWNSVSNSSSSITVTPSVTTAYSVTGTGSTNCVATAVVIVTVIALPPVSALVSPTTLCVGNSATLTGLGASTFTWNNGPSGPTTTVNPLMNTVYTVSGTGAYGCTNSTTVAVMVNSNSLGITPGSSICEGSYATLVATGAVTYTWSTGTPLQGIQVSPVLATTYTVNATDQHGCRLSNIVSVGVYPRPLVEISASRSVVCKGESVLFTANGATQYTWNTAETGTTISATLPIDVPYYYSVTGTDNNGCTNTASMVITVNKCTSLADEINLNNASILYPNPNQGRFVLSSANTQRIQADLLDPAGKFLKRFEGPGTEITLDLDGFANGIYYLKVYSDNRVEMLKAIKN